MKLSRARAFRLTVCPRAEDRQHEAAALTAAGDPRGRFITVQLALATTDPDDAVYEELVDEERWLLARHAETWAARVGLRLEETSWAHGAVDQASLTWSRFRTAGPEILALARPRSLHLHGPRTDFDLLARCEGLHRVEGLSFGARLSAQEMTTLLQSPFLGRLSALAVAGTPEAIRALAAAPPSALPRLRELDLGNSELDTEAVEAIARAAWFSGLQTLLGELVSLSEEAAIAFVKATSALREPPALRRLELCIDGLGLAGASALAEWPLLSSVERLLIEHDAPVGADGISSLLASPHLGRLDDLTIDSLKLSPGAVEQLGNSTLLPQLAHVEIGVGTPESGDACALVDDAFLGFTSVWMMAPFATEDAGAAFARWRGLESVISLELVGGSSSFDDGTRYGAWLRALKRAEIVRPLRRLSLRECGLGEEDIEALVELPATCFPALESLAIHDDALGDEAARQLAAWPGLASLRSLSLRGTDLGPDGAVAIAASPYLGRLRSLDLSENALGGEGVAALLRSPGLPKLRRLTLSSTDLEAGDVAIIAAALAETKRPLELLSLAWNRVDRTDAAALGDALARSRVRTLDVSYADGLDPFGAAEIARGAWTSGGAAIFDDAAKRARPTSKEIDALGGLSGYLDALHERLAGIPGEALLRELWLWGLDLDARDAEHLARHSVVASVRDLRLGNNHRLGPEGARALAASPWLRQLESLLLDDTRIATTGLAALLTSPLMQTVEALRIERIGLTDEGVSLLADAASRLPALCEIHVEESTLSATSRATMTALATFG